jgi:hypothetical protein|tara:strand:+ start:218 stop:484 length:267 start_codon:yes stop_codon:yes gene_type:complete
VVAAVVADIVIQQSVKHLVVVLVLKQPYLVPPQVTQSQLEQVVLVKHLVIIKVIRDQIVYSVASHQSQEEEAVALLQLLDEMADQEVV